jgi:hypothetical protein
MNIPNYVNSRVVDEQGNFTAEWSNIMQQLLTELKLNAGVEGLKASPLSSAQIGDLITIANTAPVVENSAVSNSSMVFDTTLSSNQSLKIIINGVLYTVQLV